MNILRNFGIGAVVFFGLAMIVVVIAYWMWDRTMNLEIENLKKKASGEGKVITEEMLSGLPSPVKKFFRFSGVVGKKIPRVVYLEQKGRLRQSEKSNWMEMTAYQYYSTNPPAFVWRTFVPSQKMPVAMGRDHYIDGKGSILIKMLSIFKMADAEGEEMDQGAMMRYLNEMSWFPQALLGENIKWEAIDENSAYVTLTDRGKIAKAKMYFDNEGRMINFEAKRYMLNGKEKPQLETWTTPMTKTKEFNGMILSAGGDAVYKLKSGDLKYGEIEITKISFDP